MTSVNNLGLRNSLFNLINQKKYGSTEYSIAFYLLNNFNDFENLNIYRMVDECNVSRSSINRFIKDLGYQNFLDFKNGFKEGGYSVQKKILTERSYPGYINSLTDEIQSMMGDLRNRMNTEEVLKICKEIHESKNVVFLSSSTNAGIVTYFQQEFILLEKLIYSVSDSYSKDTFISSLDESDYILTFSNTGRFANATLNVIETTKAKSVLITTNRNPVFQDSYGKVYYLSSHDVSEIAENIYNRYGITYMLDIILNTYAYLYSNSKK